jgi:periplasmic protein TonB
METKKATKVNLEKKMFLFLELGLVLALGLCFAAFEWSNPEVSDSTLGNTSFTDIMEGDLINIKLPPPPPPAPPEKKVVVETFTITDKPIEVTPNVFDEPTGPTDITIIIPKDDIIIIEDPVEVIEFVKVEVKPAFPGGDAALLQFITKNTKYPKIPLELGIEGKVYVQFVIGTDGSVGSVTIARGVDDYLDKEAIRVVSTLPNWTPGKQRGKAVPVSFVLPINFNIE